MIWRKSSAVRIQPAPMFGLAGGANEGAGIRIQVQGKVFYVWHCRLHRPDPAR